DWMQCPTRKCNRLAEARDHRRENGAFSSEHAFAVEKKLSSEDMHPSGVQFGLSRRLMTNPEFWKEFSERAVDLKAKPGKSIAKLQKAPYEHRRIGAAPWIASRL